MKNPLNEPPGLTVVQKNADKKILKMIMDSALESIENDKRYDLKIIITQK